MITRVLVLTVFIGIVSCQVFSQSSVNNTDYRDVYVGRYLCTCFYQGVDSNQNKLTYHNDTITIYITKDPLDSILIIDIGQNMYQVKLKKEIIYAYPSGNHWGGRLSTNGISFGLSTSMTTMCKYKGKKEPNKKTEK